MNNSNKLIISLNSSPLFVVLLTITLINTLNAFVWRMPVINFYLKGADKQFDADIWKNLYKNDIKDC